MKFIRCPFLRLKIASARSVHPPGNSFAMSLIVQSNGTSVLGPRYCIVNTFQFVTESSNSLIRIYLQCSRKCGSGVKTRSVICQQLLGLGEVASKPDRHCYNDNPKPETSKTCNAQPCSLDYIPLHEGMLHNHL